MQKFPIQFVGTPIGCLADCSNRVIEALTQADCIFSEHPETTLKLLNALGLPSKPTFLFDQHNEAYKIKTVLTRARKERVVILPRAGMPGINDPGTALVAHLLKEEYPFEIIPGPSIVTCLMACSGHFGPFSYMGYFPKKKGEAEKQLTRLSTNNHTGLYLESPHRIKATLTWLKASVPQKADIQVLHEYTKSHETVFGGLVQHLPLENTDARLPIHPPKGEWAFALTLNGLMPDAPMRWIAVKDLTSVLRRPYPDRIKKFAVKYNVPIEKP